MEGKRFCCFCFKKKFEVESWEKSFKLFCFENQKIFEINS